MVQDQATFPQAMAVVLEPRCNRMTTGVVVEILGCACLHERSLYPIVGMDVRKHTFVLAHLQHTLQDALCVGWEWGLVGALLRGLSRLSVLERRRPQGRIVGTVEIAPTHIDECRLAWGQ